MVETSVRTVRSMPLLGGSVVFDFLNTRGGSLAGPPADDVLHDYADLVTWSERAGTVTSADADRLVGRAARHRRAAAEVHARAVAVRRYLYELFGTIREGRDPDRALLSALRQDEADAIAHARLVPSDAGFVWSWDMDEGLSQPLWPVIHAATLLLLGSELSRIKRCQACGWFFLDESKNRSRRWCRMEDCGTAEKMRRYVSRRAARRTAPGGTDTPSPA